MKETDVEIYERVQGLNEIKIKNNRLWLYILGIIALFIAMLAGLYNEIGAWYYNFLLEYYLSEKEYTAEGLIWLFISSNIIDILFALIILKIYIKDILIVLIKKTFKIYRFNKENNL